MPRARNSARRPETGRGPGRRIRGLAPWLSLFLALGVVACVGPERAARRAPLPCTPHFAYAGGWLGGDAAYSVPLGDGHEAGERRTLWLFGDSFVGAPDAADRIGAALVHNSIGISRCGPAGFEIAYAWGRGDAGTPAAFFEHPRAAEGEAAPYWWLFDGFRLDGALYIGLLELTPAEPRGPLALPFETTGMHLARIENPSAAPEDWRVTFATLSRSSAAFPAAAIEVHAGAVYFFTFTPLVDGRQHRVLTRLQAEAFARWDGDLSDEFETLGADGAWRAGFAPGDARIVMDDNATEMSVDRDDHAAPHSRWRAVYGAPIQIEPLDAEVAPAASSSIYLRTAERLEGPWSERTEIYRIPELTRPSERGTICYAAKNHAAFAPPDGLFVTYVCNLHAPHGEDPYAALERLQRNMRLYRPIGVALPLPTRPAPAPVQIGTERGSVRHGPPPAPLYPPR